MELFHALTGTETVGFLVQVKVLTIKVVLEPYETIILGDTSRSFERDGTIITMDTGEFADSLAAGVVPVVNSLFSDEEFHRNPSTEFKEIIKIRQHFVTNNYYKNVADLVKQALILEIEPGTDSEDVDFKNIMADKMWAHCLAEMAYRVSSNKNFLGYRTMRPESTTEAKLNRILSIHARELMELYENTQEEKDFPYVDFFKRARITHLNR